MLKMENPKGIINKNNYNKKNKENSVTHARIHNTVNSVPSTFELLNDLETVETKVNSLVLALKANEDDRYYYLKENLKNLYVINKKTEEIVFKADNLEDYIDYICKLYNINVSIFEMKKELKKIIKLEIKKQHHVKFIFDPKNLNKMYKKDNLIYFNTFNTTKYIKISENKNLRHNHLSKEEFERLFPNFSTLMLNLCEDNYDYVKIVLNFLAALVQERDKLNCVITFRGVQGGGKNLFFDSVVKKLLNEKQTLNTNLKALEKNFNADLMNKLVILVDESEYDTKHVNNVAEKIKNYSTNPEIRIERKHRDAESVKTYFNFFIFTNKANGIKIDPDDRRFYVFRTKNTLKQALKNKLGVRDNFREYIRDNFFNTKEADMFLTYIATLKTNLDIATEATLLNSTKMQMIFSTNNLIDLFVKITERKDLDTLVYFYRDLMNLNEENKIKKEDNQNLDVTVLREEEIEEFFINLIDKNRIKTALTHKVLELYLTQNQEKYSLKNLSNNLKKFFEIKTVKGIRYYYFNVDPSFTIADFFEKIENNKEKTIELIEDFSEFDFVDLYDNINIDLLKRYKNE